MYHQIDDNIENGQTALSLAAGAGHVSVVEYLLQRKANLNHVTHSGISALSAAALNGHLSVCELLVKRGASLRTSARSGPVRCAALNDHATVCRFLLENGGDSSELISYFEPESAYDRARRCNSKPILEICYDVRCSTRAAL